MVRPVQRSDIAALARGCALLGSGGGGRTTVLELLAGGAPWPLDLHAIEDLDPQTPCVAAGFAGSTMVLAERLPTTDPFEPLIAAVELWTGATAPAICCFEIGGLNGLTPFVAADGRAIVDADCMGRALPGLDQMTLLVDEVPGIVFAAHTGSGVVLVQSGRGADAEAVLRTSLAQAGGTGAVVLGGFTVGDLRAHAVTRTISRALELGHAFTAVEHAPLPELASALGARVVAAGRIVSSYTDARDPKVQSIEIEGLDAQVHRLITRSESLALVSDGTLVSASPAILAVLDARSRNVLEVPQLTHGQHVVVIELPAPQWWLDDERRRRRVAPSAYGIDVGEPRMP